jgi:hypothetical protein
MGERASLRAARTAGLLGLVITFTSFAALPG